MSLCFVSDLNVAVLSEEEMKETKGEFWVFVAQTAGAWVLGKILDEIYDEIFK